LSKDEDFTHKGGMRTLFATRLYEASLAEDFNRSGGFAAFNAELEQACRGVADEDAAGRAWSKAKGYAGYTSYASLGDLPRRATVFDQLKKKLDRHAAKFAEALAFDLDGRLALDSLWINILKPGGAHSGHIHPHSVLSGTVYVTVPPAASAIRFEDPRLPMMMAAPVRHDDAPEDLQTFVSVTPEAGTVLMWESWLRHEVPANAAKAERISVSFNYGVR
jgi:uncharacterized protein (TIGR02466 family)